MSRAIHDEPPPAARRAGETDVLVYGATSAGVCAAVAAAEAGSSVLLLEPGRHLGGMTSGGLGYTDVGDLRVLAGMAARFRDAIARHYGVAPGAYAGPEPHVAEQIFREWLERAGVDVVFDARIASAETASGRIESVTTGAGERFAAGVYIDATYEGDLLALAGVPASVGREHADLHGERFAGRQEVVPGMHAFPPWISPFAGDESGLEEGPLLPQLKPGPLARVGAGDGGVMSYGYRLCLTTAEDRIPIERRDGYDEAYWELGRRLFRHWGRGGGAPPAGRMIGLEQNLPGGKCDANSLGPFSLSVLDGSAWEYPLAGPERREELRLHHLHHAVDFLWFLSTDPAVPPHIRTELSRWGLPADEFADTEHLPHQLYVREARRMRGEHVLTEHDLVEGRIPGDTVALGSYHLDIREVQRTWRWVYEHPRPIGMVVTEGYLSVPVPPYGIPYRSITPRREDCRNLLVPVCVSASHVAFSSVRMEPQYQMLGHAAGLAAAMAADSGGDVQDVDVPALRDRLASAGQILAL
ncbi:FAD-dependent oxidoreductase [Naasia sp. SYSU D00948]|uniref:FAD-dependent oxidoreductase n=1 Tax=Naasia sp. SYSU D00948 TaxID=2817379 RepID=UPI0027DBAEDF|nr:FAD-dependent oxidoreductase [Naasia sp. SYSU D00948]